MSGERDESTPTHEPVLLREVVDWLRPKEGGTFVDCTLGLGGHAEALLAAAPNVRLIGIDRDPNALELAGRRLDRFGDRFTAVHSEFSQLADRLSELELTEVKGILADFGVSSLQFDQADRGFSFLQDGPLDMRMDSSAKLTAADLVNDRTEAELADLIFELGEERAARRIARAIVRERQRGPIETTGKLAELVVRAVRQPGRWRIHPATKTFQALRIAVNDELNNITALIPAAISSLTNGGRAAFISFHSLEDRIVKRELLRESGRCTCELRVDTAKSGCSRCGAVLRVEILTKRPITASEEETLRNPRARSAKLRVAQRV
jgi:16S rRNA (cytosine1402-N4)-methyltransferase